MDFDALFTESARSLLRRACAKGLISYFDYRGPYVDLSTEGCKVSCAMHRIQRGLLDLVSEGIVFFDAEVAAIGKRRYEVVVSAAASSADLSATDLAQVLERLHLRREPAWDAGGPAVVHARGVCPATGADVSFLSIPEEGSAFVWRRAFTGTQAAEQPTSAAHGAIAWLIPSAAADLRSVTRRLRRRSWQVQRLPDLCTADRMLEHIGRRQRPAILIKGESGEADAERLEELVARHPWLWAVLAVLPGSATLANCSGQAVDVRVLPLSPREIDLFTWHAAHGAHSDHPTTHAGALYGPRRKILVVDDNTVNLVVAQGMLEALGHDVSVAQDGVQALEWCQAHPPDLVLMDIDMPVLSGDEATRYLRDWQRVGKVPPFPIVAATTLWHADAARVCADAEMDGLLEKPLRLASLNRELLRLLPRG